LLLINKHGIYGFMEARLSGGVVKGGMLAEYNIKQRCSEI
jgi:hypothetical protein